MLLSRSPVVSRRQCGLYVTSVAARLPMPCIIDAAHADVSATLIGRPAMGLRATVSRPMVYRCSYVGTARRQIVCIGSDEAIVCPSII